MKWFKHQATARNDERIARLEDKAGLEGYGFYFKMLEIVAEVIDSTNRHEVTYSLSRWGRQVNVTTKKFVFLVQCCHDVGLMIAQRVDDDMIVKIPNLLKYRDNHTKNLQVTSKQEEEEETDIEEKKKEQNNSSQEARKHTSERFEEFWNIWPATDRRTQKSKCLTHWKSKNLDSIAETILTNIAALKETEKWVSGFEPAPMTYLNGKLWEDGLPTIQRQPPSRASPQIKKPAPDNFESRDYGQGGRL